jgi:hypothetical protein
MLAWLLHRDKSRGARHESARVDEMIERVIEVNPRLQLARRYRQRLASAVSVSIGYIDELLASLPSPHEASAAAWSLDPTIRAFFATPDDLIRILSREEELRSFIAQNPDLKEVHATLGMAMSERHALGVALEGDAVRHDVVQTMLCFHDHHVRICGRTKDELHQEIARRLVDQLALEGLAKLAADRHDLVSKGRKLLKTRLALLERRGVGIRAVVGASPDIDSQELSSVQALIEQNARELAAMRVPTDEIELRFERVCEVLSKPSSHAEVTSKRFRIDLMNVVRDKHAQDEAVASQEIEFHLARIPGDPPTTRAFALVRFPCAELLPGGFDLDAASRLT